MSLRAKAKAAQPYLAGAAKISLEALKELADVIPVPFIQTFVASACKVIRIVEVRHLPLVIRRPLLKARPPS